MNAIYLETMGLFGNQLIELMFAEAIIKKTGKDIKLVLKNKIPHLKREYSNSINFSEFAQIYEIDSSSKIDIQDIVNKLSDETLPTLIKLKGFFQRVEYFNEYKSYFADQLLAEWNGLSILNHENILFIHIRAGNDTLKRNQLRYFPLPHSWYEYLIRTTKKTPVFFGELNNFYGELLRMHFPKAVFVTCEDSWTAFNIIKHAEHAVLSLSTFCWTAIFLSKKIKKVYFPLAGLFQTSFARNLETECFIERANMVDTTYFDFGNLRIKSGDSKGISELLTLDEHCFKQLSTADINILIDSLP